MNTSLPRLAAAPILVVFVVLVASLAGATTAAAAPRTRVAVLRVDFEGRVPEVSRNFLSERVVEGLAGAGFDVTAISVVKNAFESPESCRASDCYRAIAERLGVEYLVAASVRADQRNYDLTLELISGSDGKRAGEDTARCEFCGVQEVGERLDKLAASLTRHARARVVAARVTILSQPVGASVAIDGRAAGSTPVTIDLPPGGRALVLEAPGHYAARKSITVESGVSQVVSVDLLPAAQHSGEQMPPATLRTVGWTALGVGLAAVAAGVVLTPLDLDSVECTAAQRAANATNCHRQIGSDGLGPSAVLVGALIGAGGMTAVTGGLLLYFNWSAPAPAAEGPATATSRPWTVGVHGTF